MTMMRFILCALALALIQAGTSSSAVASAPGKIVYILPFQAIMVPAELEERIFELLVDRLNEEGGGLGYRFIILKETADPQWLSRQIRIEGELFGYLEESGCCFTEIRLKTRVQLHRPGETAPLVIDYPRELFFSNERTSLEAERRQLAEETAATLTRRLLAALPAP